jgi:hypothetical protein
MHMRSQVVCIEPALLFMIGSVPPWAHGSAVGRGGESGTVSFDRRPCCRQQVWREYLQALSCRFNRLFTAGDFCVQVQVVVLRALQLAAELGDISSAFSAVSIPLSAVRTSCLRTAVARRLLASSIRARTSACKSLP